MEVSTVESQRVQVEWKEQGFDADHIWMVD
jgi:pyrimidine operon attenuation protein/uracil phosphoribosyltransferase